MNKHDKSHIDTQFYTELTNKFFHPESYFYYCIKNYLRDESLFTGKLARPTLQTISDLIQYLLESNDPARELQEISQLKGYTRFYKEFQDELMKLDLSNLDRKQTKKIINDLALTTLKNMIQLISQNNRNRVLRMYLDLKRKLKLIVEKDDGGNGDNLIPDLPEIEPINQSDTSKPESAMQPPFLLAEEASPQQTDSIFKKFFREEIRRFLIEIPTPDKKSAGGSLSQDLIEKWKETFYKINELAKFHDCNEIETISSGVLHLIDYLPENKFSMHDEAIELLREGKQAIEDSISHPDDAEAMGKFIRKYEDYILRLKDKEAKAVPEQKSDDEIVVQPEFIPTIDNKEFNEQHLSVDEAGAFLLNQSISLSADNLKKDILQFNLPGEDDEDLIRLIQEISTSMSMNSDSGDKQKKIVNVDDQFANPVEVKKASPAQEKKVDSSAYDDFNREAQLYIQVILNSIDSIKIAKDVQSSSEDLELACSSLKHLAKKCGLEKFAFLPELTESILINTRAVEMKIPLPILQKIEEGIRLLNIFDPNNRDQETKLMSILASLKEYYEYTLTELEKTPIL